MIFLEIGVVYNCAIGTYNTRAYNLAQPWAVNREPVECNFDILIFFLLIRVVNGTVVGVTFCHFVIVNSSFERSYGSTVRIHFDISLTCISHYVGR